MEVTSLSRAWVFSILKRYNEEGPEALVCRPESLADLSPESLAGSPLG
jgi:hypothetical protein